MTVERAMAAAAVLVSTAFALSTLERWLARRRRYDLAWSTALAMFAIASGALWLGASAGWDAPTFRVFYLFGAVLNVPFLALGTIYLLGRRRRGDRWAVGLAVAAAFATGVLVAAPLTGPIPADRLPQGSEVFGPLPRVLAAVSSGGAALVVFAGAAWTAWRRRGRLATANGLIAAGTLVLATSGLLNSVAGEMTAFAITLVAGVTLIFAGFLVAVSGPAKQGLAGDTPLGTRGPGGDPVGSHPPRDPAGAAMSRQAESR